MLSTDNDILKAAENWRKAGRAVALATVVETWGSAPRPAGFCASAMSRSTADSLAFRFMRFLRSL